MFHPGLLKCRLNELGIKAKTHPEFIERAKEIVCDHHELQRNNSSLEDEVKQLEVDHEKMLAKQEKEFIERSLKERPDMSPAKV